MNQVDNAVLALLILIVAVLVLLQLVKVLSRLGSFLDELRYINMELGRCSAQMRSRWRRRRRRLWCSFLIPFYRRRT